MFLLFSYRGLSPDYFYIPPKSPFGKGGLLGWGFPTSLQKGQQLQNLSKTVRDFDCAAYSKRRNFRVSPFFRPRVED